MKSRKRLAQDAFDIFATYSVLVYNTLIATAGNEVAALTVVVS